LRFKEKKSEFPKKIIYAEFGKVVGGGPKQMRTTQQGKK